jgi:hypothetical protein
VRPQMLYIFSCSQYRGKNEEKLIYLAGGHRYIPQMLFILFLYKAYVKTRNNCIRQGASLDAVNPCLFPSASISYRRFVCGCVLQYVVVLWCVQKPPIGPIGCLYCHLREIPSSQLLCREGFIFLPCNN